MKNPHLIQKYRNMGAPVKASLWYTICNVIQKGISFIVVPIYVRLLTTAEYGQYSTFSSWRDLIIIFASLNLYCGVYTKAMVDNKEDRDRYTSAMQGLGLMSTILIVGVYLCYPPFWNGLLGANLPTMISLFVYFLAFPALSFWNTRQRVDYKYRKVIVITLLIAGLTPVLGILLLKFTNLRAEAVIYGYLWTYSAFGMFFFVYQFIKGKTFFHKEYWVRALKFNIPLLPHYVSLIVLGQTDRLMVQHYLGDADAGIYSFASQIGHILSIVGSAISASLVPWMYERLKQKDPKSIQKTASLLIGFVALACFGLVLITPEVVKIMGTDEYAGAIYAIPLITAGFFFTFCYELFATVEFYFSSTKFVMIATTSAAILNLLLNMLFIPRFGYVAAAATTLFCDIALATAHYFAMKWVLKKKELDGSPVDIRIVLIIAFVLAGLIAGVMALYNYIIVRYVLTGVILILLVIFHKPIINKFKELRKK